MFVHGAVRIWAQRMGKAKKGYRTEFARIAKRNSITIIKGAKGGDR